MTATQAVPPNGEENSGPAAALRPDPAAAPWSGRGFCRNCAYELTGLASGACPECGRSFDPLDPETMQNAPIDLRRRARRLRWGVMLLVVLLIGAGMVYNYIPLPVSTTNWRCWKWRGMLFGELIQWNGNTLMHTTFWAGDLYKARAFNENDGALKWEMILSDEGLWSLRVPVPGVHWRDLIPTFNFMKQQMFSITFNEGVKNINDAPFEVSGNMVDVVSTIISRYELDVQTMLRTPDQKYVWEYDREARRLVARDITPEEADTLQLNPFYRNLLYLAPIDARFGRPRRPQSELEWPLVPKEEATRVPPAR